MLLDSNIIIYATDQKNDFLRKFISTASPFVSSVSIVEVLGYHKLTPEMKDIFELFFSISPILEISQNVIWKAVELRQKRKMSFGDSIIAATCLIHSLKLITRNVEDFKSIEDLKIINPFDE